MPSPLDQPDPDVPHALDDQTAQLPTEPQKQPLAIENPPAQEQQQETEQEVKVRTLDVGEGNVVKLDALGPMIINSDGVSRLHHFCAPILLQRADGRRSLVYRTGRSSPLSSRKERFDCW